MTYTTLLNKAQRDSFYDASMMMKNYYMVETNMMQIDSDYTMSETRINYGTENKAK